LGWNGVLSMSKEKFHGIQIYVGDSDANLSLWEDTLWEDIKLARKLYPSEIYRDLSKRSRAVPEKKKFYATPETCRLRKGGE
jgi:hypothetical protein